MPVLFNESTYKFELGKGITMKDGKDITIIGTGTVLCRAAEAADILEKEGISVRLINIHTIKPIDKDLIVRFAKQTGAVVTAEEHNIINGLGSAVCEVIAESYPVPVMRVGINDSFGRSGKVPPLLEMYGLTAANIAANVKKAIELK